MDDQHEFVPIAYNDKTPAAPKVKNNLIIKHKSDACWSHIHVSKH